MILKKYNENTGKLESMNIVLTQLETDDNGQQKTETSSFNNIQDSINNRLSISGDTMKGSIQFQNKDGLKGVLTNNSNECKTSKIEYIEKENNADCGYFRVSKTVKDLTDVQDLTGEGTTTYFNLECDPWPVENSNNLITSGTLYNIIQKLAQQGITITE